MRRAFQPQLQIGQVPIGQIGIDVKSRDDIPSILHGLKRLYMEESVLGEVMELLKSHVLAGKDHSQGRPGMDFWQILVLGVLKQGLNCDFDRLKELADQHATIREMLGFGPLDATRFSLQRLIDNVGHLTPELLGKINRIVVATVMRCLAARRTRCTGVAIPSWSRPICIIPRMSRCSGTRSCGM